MATWPQNSVPSTYSACNSGYVAARSQKSLKLSEHNDNLNPYLVCFSSCLYTTGAAG